MTSRTGQRRKEGRWLIAFARVCACAFGDVDVAVLLLLLLLLLMLFLMVLMFDVVASRGGSPPETP